MPGFLKGYWLYSILAVVAIWLIWKLVRRLLFSKDPLLTFVVLRSEHRSLDVEVLTGIISKAFNVKLDRDSSDADGFVVGQARQFFVSFGGFEFVINNVPEPFVEDPEGESRYAPEGTREAFARHRAWVAVHLLKVPKGTTYEKACQYLGKLIGALADECCLIIHSPQSGAMDLYDPQILADLQGPDPFKAIEVLAPIPVVDVPIGDPRMKAAVAEARRHWPEFVKAFEERGEDDSFLVKAAFTEGRKTEYMWVSVTVIEGAVIHGTLESRPAELKRLGARDEVRVELEDLNDWTYFVKGKQVGGFTIEVLRDRMKEITRIRSR